MPEDNIIIVVDGGGAKQEAINWLRTASENQKYISEHNKGKQVMVMNLSEFLIWVNKTFR